MIYDVLLQKLKRSIFATIGHYLNIVLVYTYI